MTRSPPRQSQAVGGRRDSQRTAIRGWGCRARPSRSQAVDGSSTIPEPVATRARTLLAMNGWDEGHPAWFGPSSMWPSGHVDGSAPVVVTVSRPGVRAEPQQVPVGIGHGELTHPPRLAHDVGGMQAMAEHSSMQGIRVAYVGEQPSLAGPIGVTVDLAKVPHLVAAVHDECEPTVLVDLNVQAKAAMEGHCPTEVSHRKLGVHMPDDASPSHATSFDNCTLAAISRGQSWSTQCGALARGANGRLFDGPRPRSQTPPRSRHPAKPLQWGASVARIVG